MSIRQVGIIGAGNMGSGIAQKIAQEGFHVVLIDTENRLVQRGIETIKNTLSEGIKKGLFSPEQTEIILQRIRSSTDLNSVKDTDLLIEVIFEDKKVKMDLFKRLSKICGKKTIFASNTSSFSINDLAASTNRADKFLGLHFFYHPAKNRLVEIIPNNRTSKEAISIADRFSQDIGKIAIHVTDSPGFAVNRFFVPWLNEATKILEEGIANIPTIDDTAKKIFNIGMGPFELMNATGIPIAYHSTLGLGEKLGEFYLPSYSLRQQFEKREPWDLRGVVESSKARHVEKRLIGVVFTIACSLLEEKTSSIDDINRGAKVGLRWGLGPFEMMNTYGIKQSHEIVTEFVKQYPLLKIPSILTHQMKKDEAWSFNYVDLNIKDNIARICFNRPEAMNAINEEVMRQLDSQFTIAESNPKVKAIILEGAGKTFVAGADIQYFIKKIKEQKINDIYTFTKYGHEVLNKIDMSKKLVVVKLNGLALGGGAEIALAADTIIATEKGSIGFPETGIGIYPGLGGTQRTTKYIGKELAKYLIFTGKILDGKNAASLGIIEYIVPAEEFDAKINELINSGKILKKSNKPMVEPPNDFQQIKEYFLDKNIQKILSGNAELNDLGKKISKTISYKAPLAISLANQIIDEGSRLDLQEGLKVELSHLTEIFSTQDALEGLNSVLTQQRPSFKGK